jgi:hypothetical protein
MGLGGAIISSEPQLPHRRLRIPSLSGLVDYPRWASRLFPNLMVMMRRDRRPFQRPRSDVWQVLILTFAGDELVLTRKISVFLLPHILPSTLGLLSILHALQVHYLLPILNFEFDFPTYLLLINTTVLSDENDRRVWGLSCGHTGK